MTHPTPNQPILYVDDGYDSHVARLLLQEKQLAHQLKFFSERPEELAELNPYKSLPIFVDKGLVLYEINIICDYLEDRHKAHNLLPIDPQDKARVRLLAWRLQQDWLKLGRILLTHPDSFDAKSAQFAQKKLNDLLVTLSPLFARHEFFMSANFGWCDVLLAPLLWRLPQMNINLPPELCQPLLHYMERLFQRPSFQSSLTTLTQEFNDDD